MNAESSGTGIRNIEILFLRKCKKQKISSDNWKQASNNKKKKKKENNKKYNMHTAFAA